MAASWKRTRSPPTLTATPTVGRRRRPHRQDLPTGAKSSINFPDSIGPNIRLRGLTHGPDGALWFSYNGLLTRVTQAGARADFPVAVGTRPTVGADGNLWFPETDTGMIARVTPAALISRFPGASLSALSALALGPDGNLWYTNATAGTIGRVSAAGIITELPVPEGWCLSPGSRIASDGDSGLWVVLTDRIGHMDLAGHALGAFYAGLAPSSIALGADGNLWFVTLFVSAIGWITPSGQVHELTAPFMPYAQPSDIAAEATARSGRPTSPTPRSGASARPSSLRRRVRRRRCGPTARPSRASHAARHPDDRDLRVRNHQFLRRQHA